MIYNLKLSDQIDVSYLAATFVPFSVLLHSVWKMFLHLKIGYTQIKYLRVCGPKSHRHWDTHK